MQPSLSVAQAWLDDDPDPTTRDELRRLIDAVTAGDVAAAAEIDDAFRGPLTFGTAGLRGRMGPGPHRMNRVTVSRAAAGIADGQHILDVGCGFGGTVASLNENFSRVHLLGVNIDERQLERDDLGSILDRAARRGTGQTCDT